MRTAAPLRRDEENVEEKMENCALKIYLRDVGRSCRRSVDWRETGVNSALNITPKTTD
jgi:hypothetical protein